MSIHALGTEFTKTTFPGGESCIRLTAPVQDLVTLGLYFESNNDLFDLSLLVDAIRRERENVVIQLFMPYVPYARQDRVCNPGESLSIKVVASFINSLYFHSVLIVDPHSDVTTALFDRVTVRPQEDFAVRMATEWGDPKVVVIVAPDAGASKKARKFAQVGEFGGLVQAEKVRDLLTGKILETRVECEHVGNKDFLIVDDICDGGRTFTELAKVLRTKTDGQIFLFVTHGIFSAGEKVFDGLIDIVYTANPVGATGNAAVASGKVRRI